MANAIVYVLERKLKRGTAFATGKVTTITLRDGQSEKCLRVVRDLVAVLKKHTVIYLSVMVEGIEYEWRYDVT